MRVWTFEWMEGDNGKQVQYTDEELAALDPAVDSLSYLDARKRAIQYFKSIEYFNELKKLLCQEMDFRKEQKEYYS